MVFADADLDSAIPSAVWSIYYAAGQSCEARSRVLVELPLYDDFVAAFSEKAGQVKMGDPLDAETQMGSLISQAHRERVHAFVEGAREEGGEVVLGGGRVSTRSTRRPSSPASTTRPRSRRRRSSAPSRSSPSRTSRTRSGSPTTSSTG